MSYNPEIPKNRYDNYGDSEWTRLEKDGHGELLYHVHLDILKRYIAFTKVQGTLDCGMNIIYVLEKL